MYRFIEREIFGIIIFTMQSMHKIQNKYERNKTLYERKVSFYECKQILSIIMYRFVC